MGRNSEDGRYEVLKKLGQGGQGAVYLVRCRKDGKKYAQKRIKPYHGERKPCEQYILEEIFPGPHRRLANLIRAFHHSSIDHLYLEYCEVGDLGGVINRYLKHRTIIPEGFIWHVYKQLCEALALIHYGYDSRREPGKQMPENWHPVVHRDIKPENVLLTFAGKEANCVGGLPWPSVVLADFGLAAVVTDRNFNVNCDFGTMAYRGPEFPVASSRSDVWAMGGCIHALAYDGRPPILRMPEKFEGSKVDWMVLPEAKGTRRITDQYSSKLEYWMNKACDRNYKTRPRSYELLKALNPIATREREVGMSRQPKWAWGN